MERAHPEHGKLGYVCVLHLHLPLATLSDYVHYKTHTDEDEEDYAYNLGCEKVQTQRVCVFKQQESVSYLKGEVILPRSCERKGKKRGLTHLRKDKQLL